MSKMFTSNEEVKNENSVEKETEKVDILEENPAEVASNSENTEVEASTDEPKKKLNFKELFTLPNIKKGLWWFLKSYIWLAILLFIGDMVTKVCAEKYLTTDNPITIIPGFVELQLTYNLGAAFGMGDGAMWSRVLLCMISWIAGAAIIYALFKYWKKSNLWYRAILMVILAGDIGNLIDRTFFFNRGVIDFISVQPLIPNFGIFNFADSCLVVGIIILMILFIIDMIKEQKEKNKKAKEAEEKIKNDREK